MNPRSRVRFGLSEVPAPRGPACTPQQIADSQHWPALQYAVVPMAIRIPLTGVRLRDIQSLAPGMTLESSWPETEEVPLFAAGVPLSWCEFEGVEQTMAVRVTRLG